MDPSIIARWEEAKKLLKEAMPAPSYDAYILNMNLLDIDGDSVVLESPNTFNINLIKMKYLTLIENAVSTAFMRKYSVVFKSREEIAFQKANRSLESLSCALDPRYTFDSFIVGASNRFAHAACVAVAEVPAEAYNPLFIYGGVGLGKTHLMHATGHFILQQNPGMKLLYITSETFTNELINAIRMNTNQQLRDKLRSVDVLLIDDIQFIAGKDSTQEEFFHTFNHLRDNGKQIIISSDRPPKDIPTLEERLRSRFEWGLIADIQKPDYETRLAILSRKAENDHIDVDNDVLQLIAKHVDSNIRELEGSLNRLSARAQLTHERITIDLAREALDLIHHVDPRSITPERIISVVCEYMNIPREKLLTKKRTQDIAIPRQYAIYLCREMTNLSTTRIGAEFGRDHSTVMHACDKVSEMLETSVDTQRLIAAMKQKIEGR